MLFHLNPRNLEINLPKDCYCFENESALGKTYVFKLLTLINDYDMASCCCITFKDWCTEPNVIAALTKRKYDYIFLDRFDLYATDGICKAIEKIRAESIIFMDIKNLKKVKYCFPEFADIRITREKVEVY